MIASDGLFRSEPESKPLAWDLEIRKAEHPYAVLLRPEGGTNPEPIPFPVMRRFVLVRIKDTSGMSGTGVVAVGVEYPDGRVSLRWLSPIRSTENWDSVADCEQVHTHGHDGNTVLAWIDEERTI